MSATVHTSGPVFDGRAVAAVDALVVAEADGVGDEAYREWMGNLRGSLRQPTGHYQGRVTVDRRGDTAVVHDQGIVYGPWLEGTGGRNRTTRFRGYAAARRAIAAVEGRAQGVAEQIAVPYVRAMGGR